MNADRRFSKYYSPEKAKGMGRCKMCGVEYLKGEDICRFAYIDPKIPEIEYFFTCPKCARERLESLRGQKNLLQSIPPAKVRAFWRRMERLTKAKAREALCKEPRATNEKPSRKS